MGESVGALQSYHKAVEIQERLVQEHPPLRNAVAGWLGLGGLDRVLHRTALIELSLGRPAEAYNHLRQAIIHQKQALAVDPQDRTVLYSTACNLALCGPLAKDENEGKQYADEAMVMLRAAVVSGWANAEWTAHDPDLIPLHTRADFRRLLAELFDRGFPEDPFAR
jgi:hypothetical protein